LNFKSWAIGATRPGAGRPKGVKDPQTLAKEDAREAVRKKLTKELMTVADALLSRARGTRYFVTRNLKTGKFELVTNPRQVIDALNRKDGQSGEFYTDKPDTVAIREILDRCLDKAKEQEQDVKIDGKLEISWQS
jgi:hypothetical protein